MKKIISILIALVVIAVFIAVFALGDENLQMSCVSNTECQFYVNGPVYCNLLTQTCFLNSTVLATPPPENASNASTNISAASANATSVDQTALNNLRQRVGDLEHQLTNLQQQINTISAKISQMDATLSTLNSNLQNVDSQQTQSKEELKKDLASVSTGLAGLQTEVTQTKTELVRVQEDLNNKGIWITIITLVLVAAAIALLIVYYLAMKRKTEKVAPGKLTPRIQSYITQQIRVGKKFSQIREELLKAGWSEKEVSWVYQETTKSNYQSFIGKAQ